MLGGRSSMSGTVYITRQTGLTKTVGLRPAATGWSCDVVLPEDSTCTIDAVVDPQVRVHRIDPLRVSAPRAIVRAGIRWWRLPGELQPERCPGWQCLCHL
jgi:hypothetical protein